MSRKQNATPAAEFDLNKIIQVDSEILSFGRCMSGRLLGSTLKITNTSSKCRIITIQLNSDSFRTTAKQLLKNFVLEDLPLKFKEDQLESKNLYKHWSIEQPVTKQLISKVVLELEPGQTQSIIVVLRTPVVTKAIDMLTSLKITCSGISFIQKQLESGRRKLMEQSKEIFMCGRLENPIVICQKSLINDQLQ